jgi:hypothetical protein
MTSLNSTDIKADNDKAFELEVRCQYSIKWHSVTKSVSSVSMEYNSNDRTLTHFLVLCFISIVRFTLTKPISGVNPVVFIRSPNVLIYIIGEKKRERSLMVGRK